MPIKREVASLNDARRKLSPRGIIIKGHGTTYGGSVLQKSPPC